MLRIRALAVLAWAALTGSVALAAPNERTPANLVLVGDSSLVSRVKDVPATHEDIYCGSMPCPTIPAACPPALLVDSSDWRQSWIYRKITDPMECGDLMPPAVVFTPEDRACVVSLVQKIAALP